MERLKIAVIQMAPVFLDKKKTWEKLRGFIVEAQKNGAELITWGETLIPGYPQWLGVADGANFDDENQKRCYATYWREALTLDDPIILEMCEMSKKHSLMFMGGILERQSGSTYCTLITVKDGELLGRHRKIKPTYEERLVWADGDAKGLRVYDTRIGKIGGLNCWENWVPLARTALHQQGEMIHLAIWPGSLRSTQDITRFIALEGRSWVISASGMLRKEDVEHLAIEDFPLKEKVMESKNYWQNGGSMVVNPKGEVVAGPLVDEEGILYADLDIDSVIMERQNFDISGHYSRRDIFSFHVNN